MGVAAPTVGVEAVAQRGGAAVVHRGEPVRDAGERGHLEAAPVPTSTVNEFVLTPPRWQLLHCASPKKSAWPRALCSLSAAGVGGESTSSHPPRAST